MTIQLVRKPPIGNVKSERLKAPLAGKTTPSSGKAACLCSLNSAFIRLMASTSPGQQTVSLCPCRPTCWNARQLRDELNRIMPKDRDRDRER